MSARLPDTNIISHLLRHNPIVHMHLVSAVRDGDPILLSPMVEFEIKRGLLRNGSTTLTHRFETLTASFDYRVFDRQVWLRAAEFWAELRRQGIPLQDADILIAAQAYEQDAVLVTNNERHFTPFASFGLRIEDWTK